MTVQRNVSTDDINCETCQDFLPEYVRRELANEPVEVLYPDVAFHIETCPTCEAAYYREFRRQGLAKPIANLQQVGRRASVASVLDQILTAPIEVQPQEIQPGWQQVALKYGRGWIEQATETWQQVEVFLSNLGTQQDAVPALAMAGLQGAESESAASATELLHIAPESANFELHITARRKKGELEVAVTLHERLGDFSGIEVTLMQNGLAQTATTDALGKVTFRNVPFDQLDAMRLVVRLAEE